MGIFCERFSKGVCVGIVFEKISKAGQWILSMKNLVKLVCEYFL